MATFDHGHALVVGAGGDLPNTVDDATGLADILKDHARCAYPPGQVHLLTGKQATRASILAALDGLARAADAESTIVVYFSGHGYQIESPVGAFYFLLPYGYDLAQLHLTCIDGADFTARLRAIPAQKLLLLLDCCHAGGVGEAKAPGLQMVKSPLPPEAHGLLAEGSGRVLVASSQEDELSYAGKPYSAFTLALSEALSGVGVAKQDGYVRVADLALHARQVVPGRTNDLQHPILHFEQADNFALAYYAGGETQPKGLPFTGKPEIEPEPGAWRGIDQRGQVVHGPQVSIAGPVSGQVAVAGDAPVFQFGDVSGGKIEVRVGDQITSTAKREEAKGKYQPVPKTDEELSRILEIKNKFPRTDRRFLVAAEPQRIIMEFTNTGSDIVHVDRVRYFDKALGLPSSALSTSYLEDNYHRIIPFDTNNSDILPRQVFTVEMQLDVVYKREHIEARWGELGYLFIDVVYNGEPVELQYSV
jgi:hypothetical protein